MKFWLGVHRANWLGKLDVPLFISTRSLKDRKTFPRATAEWALDSGGFTELSTYGEWQTTPAEYISAIRRYRDEVGLLEWAAPQDWMCEPHMLTKTGLSVEEHQRRTVDNYLRLQDLNPDVPVIPVLQGWTIPDYLRCIDMYDKAQVDLPGLLVGLGTVCRRQHTTEAAELVEVIADLGLRLHGFGLKMSAVASIGDLLESSDSMAWSFGARMEPPLPECSHRVCNNCPRYALKWRDRLLAQVHDGTRQMRLFGLS